MYRIYRFTLYWSSSWTLAVKCDVSVQPDFEQNITKQTANGYFTIATSPTPVQIQALCGSSQSSELDIDLRSIRVKSQNLYLDTFLLFLILILINPFCFTLRFVNPLYFFQS